MTDKNPNPASPGADPFAIGILTPHFEGIPDAVQPFMEFNAKMQSEFLTLWSHRARAWLDWPERMYSCKTTGDLASAQTEFLSDMQRHYASYCDCVFRDALIEQDELETPAKDDAVEETVQPEPSALPRKAA